MKGTVVFFDCIDSLKDNLISFFNFFLVIKDFQCFFFDSRMRLDTYNICLDSSNALLGVGTC